MQRRLLNIQLHYRSTMELIDVLLEGDEIYPKKLCNACVKKVQCQASKPQPETYLSTATFEGHRDGDCVVCFNAVKGLYNKELNLRQIDDLFGGFGFGKLPNPPVPYKRIFLKQSFNKERCRVTTELSFTIDMNNDWNISVYGKQPHIIEEIPAHLSDLESLSKFFDTYATCIGIEKFEDVISSRLEICQLFESAGGSKELAAVVENWEH